MSDGTMKIEVDLVPSTVWFTNLRSLLPTETWDTLRHKAYKDANYKCEICSAKGMLHCHELWKYDDIKHTQTLDRLITVCPNCHEVYHLGLAVAKGRQVKVTEYLMKINNLSRKDATDYIQQVFDVWRERSKYEWKTNTNLKHILI